MNFNKYSRRRFFGMSFFLAGIPIGFSTTRASMLTYSLVPDVSDQERIKGLLKQKNPLIWLFTGDSITQGAEHTHGYRSYPEIFAERIRYEMGRFRDIVINTGISGNTTQNILDDFDWRIGQFKPVVVSLMIGTNDCSKKEINQDVFEQKLDSLLAQIRGSGAIPILQTPNIIIKEKAPERAKLFEYITILQSLAKKRKVILVDNYNYWENILKNHPEINVYKKWLNDPLHPNGTGHQEIARLMFKELSIFDSKAATCGGKYYEGDH